MATLEAELERARDLRVADLADAIETIGFECTDCGACCRSDDRGNGHRGSGDRGNDHRGSGDRGNDHRGNEHRGNDHRGSGDRRSGDRRSGDRRSGDRRSGDSGVDDDESAKLGDDAHTATVFPDEVRRLQDGGEYDWRDVARPVPFGLDAGDDGEPEGETFEWALQTDDCGDCTFYDGDADGGKCTVYGDRPLVCQTYPFSVALGGTSQPLGEAVDEAGMVRAHECEGLGRDIDGDEAESLAATLKERAVRELEEAIAVRDSYEPADPDPGEVVVHDSEGAKQLDGTRYRP